MHFIMSGFDVTVKFYILFEKVLVESTIVDIDTLIMQESQTLPKIEITFSNFLNICVLLVW